MGPLLSCILIEDQICVPRHVALSILLTGDMQSAAMGMAVRVRSCWEWSAFVHSLLDAADTLIHCAKPAAARHLYCESACAARC